MTLILLHNQAKTAHSLFTPLFYRISILTWFFLLEEKLQAKKIDNDEKDQSNILIFSLSPDVAGDDMDILTILDQVTLYTALKTVLLERSSSLSSYKAAKVILK